jgi:cysteinyl-tRNA synthetase
MRNENLWSNGLYDMHGAQELICPHRESQIAQLQVLTSNQQPVTIWNHLALVNIKGEKCINPPVTP